MKLENILILAIGILLIFISLFIFTRPAIFPVWDFSETGQIGDTIGGITAPIINLIGAFLVYVSFQAQIKANKIQFDALEDEKINNAIISIFTKYQALFDEIKNRLNNLEFVIESPGHGNSDGSYTQSTHIVYKGLNALNEYVIRIEISRQDRMMRFPHEVYSTYGIFLNFQFIFTSLVDIIDRIENNVKNIEDKRYILQNIKLFYKGFLEDFGTRIINAHSAEDERIMELKRIKQIIDEKFSA